jgi:hypothetical protein
MASCRLRSFEGTGNLCNRRFLADERPELANLASRPCSSLCTFLGQFSSFARCAHRCDLDGPDKVSQSTSLVTLATMIEILSAPPASWLARTPAALLPRRQPPLIVLLPHDQPCQSIRRCTEADARGRPSPQHSLRCDGREGERTSERLSDSAVAHVPRHVVDTKAPAPGN